MTHRLFKFLLWMPIVFTAACQEHAVPTAVGASYNVGAPVTEGRNTQTRSVEGENNAQRLEQSGTGNQQTARISGDGNAQELSQDGEGNWQSGSIDGDANTQTAAVGGDDNAQLVEQVGTENGQTATISGHDNTQTLTQHGDGNDQRVVARGDGNRFSASQVGTNLDLIVEQVGDSLGLVVLQEGSGNRLAVRGDVLTRRHPALPLLAYEQERVAVVSHAEVEWVELDEDLTRGANALRIHYDRAEGPRPPLTITLTSAPGAASEARVGSAARSAAGPAIIRFAEFRPAAGALAAADLTNVASIGIRVGSGEGRLSIRRLELISVIDARADIKPGESPSPINTMSGTGVVPALLFGGAAFEVTAIDPASLELLGMPVRSQTDGNHDSRRLIEFEDVDGDGFVDAVIHFEQNGWTLPPGATESDAAITGLLADGRLVVGVNTPEDPIRFTGTPRRLW